MPTPTYTPLATVTLGASASSVTFSSIPATYRDIVVIFGGSNSSANNLQLRFNADSGSNYSFVYAEGNGSVTESGAFTSQTTSFIGNIGTGQNAVVAQVMDYSATDKHKTTISRSNRPDANVQMSASRWANTAAITSIEVRVAGGTIDTASVLSIYGIAS
jgi:hypothetical protein